MRPHSACRPKEPLKPSGSAAERGQAACPACQLRQRSGVRGSWRSTPSTSWRTRGSSADSAPRSHTSEHVSVSAICKPCRLLPSLRRLLLLRERATGGCDPASAGPEPVRESEPPSDKRHAQKREGSRYAVSAPAPPGLPSEAPSSDVASRARPPTASSALTFPRQSWFPRTESHGSLARVGASLKVVSKFSPRRESVDDVIPFR
mmetsp:Transcript_34948/g.82381  ORF Transcript_34948/g.82381 Transcript_34948/m.82381 type:complete len:205 (-) Transcript_34948:64-678(-)